MTTPPPLPLVLLTRRDTALAILLALFMGLASGSLIVPDVCGSYHDDGIYVITGKALAEGQGYRLTHLPGQPPQTKYPPLFPFLLALLWWLYPHFPENGWLLVSLPWLCGMATAALSYLYLVRFGYASRQLAVVALLCCLTSPTYLFHAATIMTEFPFALLWLVALWRLEMAARASPDGTTGKHSWRTFFLLGLLCGLPTLCRSVGIVLVPAALWICWRRKLPWFWTLLGMGVMIGPWVLWAKAGVGTWERDTVAGYYTDYVGWWKEAAPHQLGEVLEGNFLGMTSHVPRYCLQGGVELYAILWFEGLQGLILLGGVTWVTLSLWVVRGKVLAICLLAYLVLICVWPWPPGRFLLPLMPYFAVLLFTGLSVVRLPWSKATALLRSSFFVLILGCNLWLLGETILATHHYHYPQLGLQDRFVDWREQTELLRWLQENTGAEDVIAAEMDPMVYLYTGRTSFRPHVVRPLRLYYLEPGEPLGSAAEWRQLLLAGKPRYLVVATLLTFKENKPFRERLAKICQEHPDWLTAKFRSRTDPQGVIYEVHLDKIAAGK
jgi:hypothetical protein